MRSLLPVPFEVQAAGLDGDRLRIVTKGNTKVLVDFKKLHIFDLDNCGNLGAEEIIKDYLVYDMFDITAGSRLGRDIIFKPKDSFVKMVEFVTSNRIDRNTSGDFKDIVTTSLVAQEEIRSFDCSETVVRLFLERKLKEHEIKQPDGRNLKIQHSFRHTVKNTFHFKPVDELDKRIILHE